MERRLLRFIMTPAMFVTWVLGIALALQGQFLGATWFHIKLALVLVMTVTHGLFQPLGARIRPTTATRDRRNSIVLSMRYRPVILIVIVILATVKPFG